MVVLQDAHRAQQTLSWSCRPSSTGHLLHRLRRRLPRAARSRQHCRMLKLVAQEWHDQLTLTRRLTTPGERNAFYASVHAGKFVRVGRGAYVPGGVWNEASAEGRYRLKVNAVAAMSRVDLLFSHYSAAVLWRLPLVGPWPGRVHTLGPESQGGLSNRHVVRHTQSLPEVIEEIDGLNLTGLARTVVDMAAACSFPSAVAIADAALRRAQHPVPALPGMSISRDYLVRNACRLALRHSTAKVRKVIEFADGAADRPGESISRVSMHVAGVSAPRLQAPLRGASGKQYWVDFWWPQFKVIGEFDGKDKYQNPVFLRGRTPEQALYDEKLREDDLRDAGHGMVRWNWNVACSPRLLATKLYRAGVR